MEQKKLKILGKLIIKKALKIKKDERVLIQYSTTACNEFIKILIDEIVLAQGIPFVKFEDKEISRHLINASKKNRLDVIEEIMVNETNKYDSIIMIRFNENLYENNEVNSELKKQLISKYKKSQDIMINEKKWVLLNYPSEFDAYISKMSYNQFFDFSLKAMLVDYYSKNNSLNKLKKLFDETKTVKITGPNTNLIFSIENMPGILCLGEHNLPDGECYTAPIRKSVNGYISYNTKSIYNGKVYSNVRLEFENGKIIKAKCDEGYDMFAEIFSVDEGACYIGEFAIGLNSAISKPTGDILFDEKIKGSMHLTPGQCYSDCNNGNNSKIHWDLVLMQTPEFGGGSIYFDDSLILKDGEFQLSELEDLNNF